MIGLERSVRTRQHFDLVLTFWFRLKIETSFLQVQFDCRVIPMTFTSHELVFMAAMFTGFGEGKNIF